MRFNNQSFNIHNKLSAHRHPLPGVSPGNQHATPIMLCMVGAALCLSAYLCVSRAEALLMARNTSYPKRL
jgi:hypothetical protein